MPCKLWGFMKMARFARNFFPSGFPNGHSKFRSGGIIYYIYIDTSIKTNLKNGLEIEPHLSTRTILEVRVPILAVPETRSFDMSCEKRLPCYDTFDTCDIASRMLTHMGTDKNECNHVSTKSPPHYPEGCR